MRKNDKVQLHVELERSQHQQLKVAMKKLGYRTLSELVRERCVRWAIAEAKLTAQDDDVSAKEASG